MYLMYRQDCTHIFTAKPDVVFRTTFAILRYNVAILLCKLLGASCNRFQKLLPKSYNVLTIHLHIFITKHVNDYKVHVEMYLTCNGKYTCVTFGVQTLLALNVLKYLYITGSWNKFTFIFVINIEN